MAKVPGIDEGQACRVKGCLVHTQHTFRPIRLSDVLRATDRISDDMDGNDFAVIQEVVMRWNLADDDLAHQSLETIEFLNGII